MSTESRRFLMPMWEGGGTIPPELGVARRLIERGHTVHVLGDPTIRDEAESTGCTFSSWRRAPHRTSLDRSQDPVKDWETSNPLVMLRRIRDIFITGPAADYAADTMEAIETESPDVVVPDAFLFGAIIAAQAARVPVAPLLPQIWMLPTRGTPAIGPGFPLAKTALGRARDRALLALVNRLFAAGLPKLNAARAAYALPPLSSFYDQVLDVDRIVVLTSPTFDFAAPFVPRNARYVGPILDDPQWAGSWTSPWPEANADPLVLVGFSSTYQNQGPLLRRIVEALASLPLRAVVTLGEMLDAGEVTPAENVAVVKAAPHSRILEEASLVVTHCGHGTTMKALAAGVPMVCLPMGRDQNDTAARVVHHRAGLRLSPSASVSKIRQAVQTVLGDSRFRAGAARMASAIAEERRSLDVVAELEELFDLQPGTRRVSSPVRR